MGDTYTITVSNFGSGPTNGTASLVDTLPAGVTATAMSGTGWTVNMATLTATRNDVLAAGASYPALTVTVNVADNAAASLTNTATVAGGGADHYPQRHGQRSDERYPDARSDRCGRAYGQLQPGRCR